MSASRRWVGSPVFLRRFAAGIAVVVVVFSGCGRAEDAAPLRVAAGWPAALNNLSVVWSAGGGIDLLTGPAVAVRAYMESVLVARLTGENRYLYPGFETSVEENDPDVASKKSLWPTHGSADKEWIGTLRNRILEITTSDQEVTAIVCVFDYGMGMEFANGFNSMGREGDYLGVEPARITMVRGDGDFAELPPQKGSARAPDRDVFGGWRITGHEGGMFATGAIRWNHVYDQYAQACLGEAPDSLENIRALSDWLPRTSFPALPAYPGWPGDPAL